ncbi:unnamed protein product [Schistosoma margrebowiei]|uniref:EGF-like domain-containing protein n=1 Tax=Schistosoma margrebowiei TaxID=48269 RepID=A0AA84ZR64_9TREM|nr:unnamed protein product [Schistosoma margrebowiei]
MHNVIGKIYTNYIYIILLILLYDVQNGLTQLNPYFQFIPQNDNLHTKIYDYSKGFDEDHFTYELQYPIPIYETLIKKINIRKNGLLALDSISDDNLPPNYPVNTSITNQRLQDFDGRYLSIFSSVNDGKRGRISVTEIDLLSPSKLPCVERMQIDRLIKFIHLSYIEESELKAQYIVHILWENMTNAYLINQKANTYGMIIISNGICSYAFMQYIKIEWNENDVAENLALPPESGIFMRPFGGYQLPRSSQAVEPNIWLTETNIALHGEWLVPLYKSENIAKINVKNLSAVASEFVASLTSVCEGSLHSRKSNNETPSDTVVIKNVNIDNTSEEPIARTQSFKRALESLENYDLNVSANDYSYGMTENVPKAAWNILRDETEFSGVDPIDQNEMNILPENETANNFYHESNQRVVDNEEYTPTDTITTQTYYPLGRYDGDEERQEIHEPLIVPVTIHPLGDEDDGEEDIIDNKEEYKSVNETFSNSLVKCDAVSECSSHNTECYRVDNAACCVCSDGFYGAGDAKCWSEVNDHKFSFSGSLTTRFGIENTSSPLLIYLDIQHGSLRRSSSGIRGGRTNDRIYSTMRLITPVFHILNSMVSSPCENIPKRERVYNLFTLGNGLQRPFKVLFQFDIERVGKFTIQAVLELHDFTTGAYANGVIQLEAFSTESLNLLDQSYIEAYSASDKPDKTYYANYKIDDHGRVVFPEQTVKFIVEHRDSNEISNFPEEINVHWSAVAESESCLLKQVSSIPKNKSYYIRLKDRGYCSEDCSSPDGTCNLFCVDEPLLLATEPSPCDCVTCDRHGEVCRPEGASYRCECGQGLKLMPDNTCQATSLVDVTNYLGVQCGSVNCHTHARCIDPNQAFCQCLPGYRGDGVSHCESDPCSKCRRNEICENGICIASGVDLCEGIQCGEQAFCQDGACVCTPGYTGDPVVKCYEERDRCFQVRCHPNAQCYNNECHCVEGFQGDGYYDCKPVVYDPCSEVRCHPYAKCRNGNCECLPDYYGDGYHVCKPRNYDPCDYVQCHQYGYCINGSCQCRTGFEGNGYYDCRRIQVDPCSHVQCHYDATCHNGVCTCKDGYIGDGYRECRPRETDLCHHIQCHPYAQCENGQCYCIEGYIGDGYYDCHVRDPCTGVKCHQYGECISGRCHCLRGYEGDGYYDCRQTVTDPCSNVQCHPNGYCKNGRCLCLNGYEGDGYYECRPVHNDPCIGVQCHSKAECQNGYCRCLNGYEGDGFHYCYVMQDDPCSSMRCHINAKCFDGECRCLDGYQGDGKHYCDPIQQDQCQNIRCHEFANCQNGRCQCNAGYEGDGYWECKSIKSDPCSSMRCHINAKCFDGECRCLDGYQGDGKHYCDPIQQDQCQNIRCHEFANCQNGRCQCNAGYEGDGYWECKSIKSDPCSSMRCHINAKCFDGECRCLDGYQGDGKHYCDPIQQDQCQNIRCHEFANCQNGRCQCNAGYEGDGYWECKSIKSDQCQNIRCHEFANCQNGRCQCNAGYEGDGYWECKSIKSDLCKYVRCHENAKCNEQGKCQCLDGYSGDGYYECQKSSQELCAGVQCHRFGQCYENRCYCSHGYVGDGVNFCDARANDPCDGVRCAANGRCQDGRCVCDPGYTGDGYNECREAEGVKLCGNVQCHQYATCDRGQCRCVTGYDGDGYSDCRPVTEDKCSRMRCHPDAQCTDGYCFCPTGFEGDGYYECKRITQDRCANVRCHENAKCDDGYCRCKEGFEGDGYSECRRKSEDRDPCARIRCHPQAQCEYGFCRCKNGYKGDGYWNCQPIQSDLCRAEQCHQFARCVEGQCRCLDGYEGDGYQMCNIIPGATSADCGNCNGIPFKEIAQCVGGRCVCARGFIEVQAGVCMECVQDNCHQDAVCRPDDRFNGAYSCHCKSGFTGDGVSVCKPESVGREDATSSQAIDPTCGGGCRIRNAECDRYTGTCKCRSGYDGDGERGCYWNCKLCHPSAICDRENERCICPSGYRGDGQTFCEQIPVRQDSIKVRIMGEGEVMHITDISHPLELRCFVTGSDQSYSGQWIQPHSAQEPIVTKTRQQDGYEISLRINQPTITDSGRYECRAGNVAAFIDVNVEESAIPFTVLLTSDDGILMTQSTDSNVTKATLWNIAENNKYGRVSMVGDCNSQRIIYTSDYGHTIRWGNSNSGQNKLVTKEIYTSQINRFRNLAVDSLSGNVFAWEEAFGKIMVFNPNKPNIHYTLESLHSLTSSEQQNFAGLALHSTLGLMYWAIYTDGWRPNGTIQVASMSGENEEQLLQLTGEPLAISISPATPVNGNSAGKLCWMQRSSKGMFGLVTELHCARLGQTGREILTNEKIREFSPSEEPSFGMTQYKGTLLWTDASKTVYYSINPDRRIRVRYVCCSNRFQAISVLGDCPQASTNPCTYSNGRCRYICLPNDGGRSRTCVCPDNEPGCHKEM